MHIPVRIVLVDTSHPGNIGAAARAMKTMGLSDLTLTPKPQYIDAMTNWEDSLYRRIVEALPAGSKPSDYITSLDVSAVKR